MKFIYSLLFIGAFIFNSMAQLGFDVGAKGQVNSTWLINKNSYDAGDEQNYSPSWGSNFGMVFGLRMGAFCTGLETNFGMHNAEFNGKTLSLSEWARLLKVSRSALEYRFKRGWPVERLLTPPRKLTPYRNENGLAKS